MDLSFNFELEEAKIMEEEAVYLTLEEEYSFVLEQILLLHRHHLEMLASW